MWSRAGVTGVVLSVVMVLAGCAETPASPDTEPTGGESPTETPTGEANGDLEVSRVTIAYAGFANNIIAHNLPEFAEAHGLEIEQLQLRSGADLLTALIDGSADTAVLTYTYVFQGLDQGHDIVAIASNMQGGTRIVAHESLGLAEGDWDGLRTLAEDRAAAGDPLVLVSSSPTINHALGFLTLEENGIDVDELLQFEDVLDPGLHGQMLQSGDADLGILGEPGAAVTVVNGWATTFAYPYDTALGPMNTEWLAMRDWVDTNPNTARALVAAIADTQAHFADDLEATVTAAVDFMGIEQEVAEEAMANYTIDATLDPDAAETAAQIFFEAGLVEQDHSDRARDQVLTELAE